MSEQNANILLTKCSWKSVPKEMIKLKFQDLFLRFLTNPADNHLSQLHIQSMNSAMISD